jgi:transposase
MILDKFLNLQGTCIQGYLHLENIGIVCRIESKNQKATCPRCGLESDKLHQNHRHLVKDLRFFVTWYGSIGGHKSTKSLSGKRLN